MVQSVAKWEGHSEPEWERDHLLRRDECRDFIRAFWARSGLSKSFILMNVPHVTGVMCAVKHTSDDKF